MAKILAITIPKWGIEMERGTISEWRVAPGESVAKGDALVDIETDKIVNSFEATEPGMLVRSIAQEGDELKVGTLIGVMATGPVTDAEVDAFIAAAAARAAPAPAAPAAAATRSANGPAAAYQVKLDTVRVGDITLNGIDAVVMENQDMPVLLGMSFLNRTDMRREGQNMVLTRRF